MMSAIASLGHPRRGDLRLSELPSQLLSSDSSLKDITHLVTVRGEQKAENDVCLVLHLFI